MDLQPINIFSRSAVFELDNTSCYFSDKQYKLYLNEKLVIQAENTNVISIYNLLPNTSYELKLIYDEVQTTTEFRTAAESFLLDVTRFGALPDGKTDCTAALQAAILCCPKDGTVCFPAGIYSSGPLFLKSDITLLLEKEVVLLGIPNRERYPILPGVTLASDELSEYFLGTWEGNPLSSFAGLLTGINIKNVNITGEGIVDANAQNGDWWQDEKRKKIAWRPRTVFLNNCENVTIHGVTLRNSYSWTLHPYFCSGLRFLDINIWNPSNSPNTDGIDPESCENVEIIGAHISVGDDCISIKSGKLFMGLARKTPSKNICIRNCLMERGHGGVAIGSEVASGINNVHITQCLMRSTDRGLRVKTRRGRGKLAIIDGIFFENIRMEHVLTPFAVNMFYFCDPDGHSAYVYSKEPFLVDERTPTIGRLACRNIQCTDCSVAGVYLYGLPEMPIKEVTLENFSISFSPDAQEGFAAMMDNIGKCRRKGVFARNVNLLRLKNVSINGGKGEEIDFDGIGQIEKET